MSWPERTWFKAEVPEKDRFFAYVEIDGSGCWFWTGATSTGGYGRFRRSPPMRQKVQAHRYAYEIGKGSIPPEHEIDHTCSNPRCVNPAHLEPVTPKENARRTAERRRYWNQRKTHCPQGHELTGDNLYLSKGHVNPRRHCRACRCEAARKYRAAI